MKRHRRTLGLLALGFVLFALMAGEFYARRVEEEIGGRIRTAFHSVGFGDLRVTMDGARPTIEGHVANDAERALALALARRIARTESVYGALVVRRFDDTADPPWQIELHRDENSLTLVGILPGEALRDEILGRAGEAGHDLNLQTLLSIRQGEEPPGWGALVGDMVAMSEGMLAGAIILSRDALSVRAVAENAPHAAALAARIRNRVPSHIEARITIEALPDVVSPYLFSAEKRLIGDPASDDPEAVFRLSRCFAPDAETGVAIEALAARLGVTDPHCIVARGEPNAAWGEVMHVALAWLAGTEEGVVAIRDDSIFAEQRPEDAQRRADLRARIPEGYLLRFPPARPRQPPPLPEGDFFALSMRREAGRAGVSVIGTVPDAVQERALKAYAEALFGVAETHMAVRLDEGSPPAAWEVAATAALKALSHMEYGVVRLGSDGMSVRGAARSREMAAQVDKALARVHAAFPVEAGIAIEPAKMDENRQASLSVRECVMALNRVVAGAPFAFEPGSADFGGAYEETAEALAAILGKCGDGVRVEIGGHTDATGPAMLNLSLSEDRALAVRDLLVAAGADATRLYARGYGASEPVASNKTSEGRAKNRRIWFGYLGE